MNFSVSLRDHRTSIILVGLGLSLLVTVLFSLTTGAVSVPVQDVAIIILQKFGILKNIEVDSMHEIVLSSIRIPRVFMTILIGASLGISGAALQGLFRNPLVEPSLIGVSGGSAAAVVMLIVFGAPLAAILHTWIYTSLLPLVAFAGGLLATFMVLRLSSQVGRTNISVLVLIGVAVNALAGALIGLAIFYADENQLRTFTFWTLGDLGGASWDKLAIASPLLLLSCIGLLFFSKTLNALALGEAEAYHIGVNVEKTKRIVILLAALGVGVSVSLAGMIGFVGLVIPHVIRVSFFPDNKLVLPASIIGGAWLLVFSDIIARVVVSPSELPIGVVTALIGAPFFIGLLMNAKRKNEL
ncbi:MAG TPA: iron ABC transporter permease [Ohtaekwangia sp.]|uniref:FecCD family ABC transporter permease n=1 Tax=Ohtaekwangia sp. TaxID=2066019 RepID=UPI002F942E8E